MVLFIFFSILVRHFLAAIQAIVIVNLKEIFKAMWSVWWWQKDDSFHTVLCMTLIHISLFGFFTVYIIFVQKTVQLNCINEWNLCFISDSIQRHIGLCTFWLYFFLISQHLIKQFFISCRNSLLLHESREWEWKKIHHKFTTSPVVPVSAGFFSVS